MLVLPGSMRSAWVQQNQHCCYLLLLSVNAPQSVAIWANHIWSLQHRDQPEALLPNWTCGRAVIGSESLANSMMSIMWCLWCFAVTFLSKTNWNSGVSNVSHCPHAGVLYRRRRNTCFSSCPLAHVLKLGWVPFSNCLDVQLLTPSWILVSYSELGNGDFKHIRNSSRPCYVFSCCAGVLWLVYWTIIVAL